MTMLDMLMDIIRQNERLNENESVADQICKYFYYTNNVTRSKVKNRLIDCENKNIYLAHAHFVPQSTSRWRH